MSNSSHRNPYDLETEIETMEILKAQNKKIHELLEEVKRKNDLMVRLQTDNQKYLTIIKENDIYKENLNFQINALGEKFKSLDKESRDKITSLTEEVNRLKKIEKNLSQNLFDKEKIMGEYKSAVEKYEEQIKLIKCEVVERNSIFSKTELEKEELHTKIKNYTMQIDLLTEEIEYIKKDQMQKTKFTSDIKLKLEDKAEELLHILKQNEGQLKTLTDKCSRLEQDNVNLHSANKKYKTEMDELIMHIKSAKEQMLQYKDLDIKFKDCEEFITHQNSQLEAERKKNIELNEIIKQLREDMLLLKESYTGDKSPDYLNQILKGKNEDIKSLQLEVNNLKTTITEFEVTRKEWDDRVSSYNTFIYGYLSTLMQWIETYLGTAINESCNITIPELKFNFNKQKLLSSKLRVKMEKCQNSIIHTHNRVKAQFSNLDNSLQQLRNENQSLHDERSALIQENHDLKNDKENLTDELESTKERFEKLMKEFDHVSQTMDSVKDIRHELAGVCKQFNDIILTQVNNVNDIIKRSNKLSKYSEMLQLSERTELVNYF
jgi:chromosome segregation ATPase